MLSRSGGPAKGRGKRSKAPGDQGSGRGKDLVASEPTGEQIPEANIDQIPHRPPERMPEVEKWIEAGREDALLVIDDVLGVVERVDVCVRPGTEQDENVSTGRNSQPQPPAGRKWGVLLHGRRITVYSLPLHAS